jgi:hypothetical protein
MSEDEEYGDEIEFCVFCRSQPADMLDVGGDEYECQDCGAVFRPDSSNKLGVQVVREPPEDW